MAEKTESSGIAPRRAALRLLQQVMTEGRLLSELAPLLESLPPEGRARAHRLALEVLRDLGRADRLLAPHLAKRPPTFVMNALRLGVVELAHGAAAHGVVNDLVAIVSADKRHKTMKGLTNAVLRKCAENTVEKFAKLPPAKLPDWLRGPLVAAWGRQAVTGMEAAQAQGGALDLTPKGDGAALAARLGGTLLPTGSVRLSGREQVTQLAGYSEGEWWVQDAAAAMPARILAAQKGEKVLDLCAAPGGKTMQLAATGADVTALDLSESRLARVGENLARTGLTARVMAGDALEFAETGWDAILLDAPCSATGTMRRHPDLPYAKDGTGFSELMDLQERMIDHALSLLKPGGRLVFCTCSLLPDEGEVQTEEALARHPDLTVDRAALAIAGVDPAWITEEGGLRLRPDYWPELGGMDGFYAVVLRKA